MSRSGSIVLIVVGAVPAARNLESGRT